MREVFACLLIGFIAYVLEWNWVAAIFVLAPAEFDSRFFS